MSASYADQLSFNHADEVGAAAELLIRSQRLKHNLGEVHSGTDQPPLGKATHIVAAQGVLLEPCTVVHDTSGQHTITWKDTIRCALPGQITCSLEPGDCNLYQYPLCHTLSMKAGRPPRSLVGVELEALSQLLLALAAQRGCRFIYTVDFFGAYPLHG